ncbi:hypothetical protein ACLK1S_27390 [Escherichia coli]
MEKAEQVTSAAVGCRCLSADGRSVARADSLDEQRSRYAQIRQAWIIDKWMWSNK